MLLEQREMAIKHLTFSVLTSGVMVLAYAAWSKWRATPPKLRVAAPPPSDPILEAKSQDPSIDVVLDDIWDTGDMIENPVQNPDEQLVDFSSELTYDEDEGSVAPEGLGVRWLTRATEAMSPFHHSLSIREEAEAALLDGVTRRSEEDPLDAVPESEQPLSDLDLDLGFEGEPVPATEPNPEYRPEKHE